MNPNHAVCPLCKGPVELEYNDDGKGIAYAHCIEECSDYVMREKYENKN